MRHAICLTIALLTAATSAHADEKDYIAYSQPTIAFVHASVVDGTGAKVRRDQTLVVDKGRIVALGDAKRVKIPTDAQQIDAHGKTLLPGFVMMHEHLFYPTGHRAYTEMVYSFPRLYLAGGTTTMRTAGTMMPYADLNLRREIDKGSVAGPDIDVTAPYLNGPGLPILGVNALGSVDDAERMVNYWADEGVTSYKAYMHIRRDELQRIIEVAHRRGHKVTAHLCSVTYREAIDLGIDNLEHGFFVASDFVKDKQADVCPGAVNSSLAALDIDAPEAKALIKHLVDHHVALTSTLTVFETFVPGRPKAPQAALDLLIPEIRAQYEKSWDGVQAKPNPEQVALFAKLGKLEKRFVEAGGLLMAGTDPTGYGGVVPGYSGKRQIELLVENGFRFEDAIRISTLNGAKFLGRDKDVGTLEVGKRADIVVVDGDPLQQTDAIENMPLVFKNGVGYKTEAIFAAMKNTVGLN